MNYTTWFHPSVTIIDEFFDNSIPRMRHDQNVLAVDRTITYGNLLHVDFGVTALGLNTDTQHLAYVLHPGETSHSSVPRSFLEGLRKANRMQDIVREKMKVGMTGNEILKACLSQMKQEGIQGKVYSHPIGDWGHSAGTLIG
jgi:hypothetical protein